MSNQTLGETSQDAEWRNEPLSADELFDLLSDRHRRVAVACLLERGTMSVDDLLDEVTPVGEVDCRTRLRARFHHSHLPRLDDAGVIEFRGPDVIEPQPSIEDLEPLLAVVERYATT